MAVTVHSPVQVLPFTGNLDVGFVHAPTHANRAFTSTKRRSEHWQDFDRSAVHGGVIDVYATFGHPLLDVTQAQRIGRVPANAREHHLQWVHPFDHLAQCHDHQRSRLVVETGGRLPALAYCDRTCTGAERQMRAAVPAVIDQRSTVVELQVERKLGQTQNQRQDQRPPAGDQAVHQRRPARI